MPKFLTSDDMKKALDSTPESVRARKRRQHELWLIGAWDAELELRNQERAFKSARKGDIRISGVSDSFPYQAPKHRKANRNTRKELSYATVAISYQEYDRELWPYRYDIGAYIDAYARHVITSGELDRVISTMEKLAALKKPPAIKRTWKRTGRK